MTPSKIPLYKPPSSVTFLDEEKSQPLLRTRIAIFYRAAEGERSIETTIGEVYRKTQKALFSEFGSPKLVIKGSSVASLFSGEPAEDVDMHYVADLTHLPERERIRRGYDLKWVVLRGIVQLIKEKMPATEKNTMIQTEDILFTEKPYMLSAKTAAPFNVHGISFVGSPVELTLFSITKTVEHSQRGFDFNSGALELYLDPEGRSVLGSYLPDMDHTLSEIKRRELTCHNPEEITRKGISRYMAKLVISGYYDKDLSLFKALLDSEIKKYKELEEVAIAKIVVETIATHFREKNISARSVYLFLWLMKGETSFIKLLSKQAKEFLLLEIESETSPKIRALSTLIDANKKAESSWFLLMQAKSVRRVIQRGESCLQIEVPIDAIFLNRHPVESVFISVPLEGLKMLTELSFPEGFHFLQNEGNLIEVRGEDTKASMQELIRETLSKPLLLPAFLTAMQKLSLKREGDFFVRFLTWFEGVPEGIKETIPLFSLRNFIESIPDNSILRPSTAVSLIKLIKKQKKDVFTQVPLRKILASIIFQLLKGDKFESLDDGDKEIIKSYGNKLALDFLHSRHEPLTEIEGEFKKIGGIVYILYQKGSADIMLSLGGAEGCLEIGAVHQTFKILNAIVTNEQELNQPVLLGFFLRLTRIHPLEFTKFAIENGLIIKRKMSSFNTVVDSLFYQLDGKSRSKELVDLFVQLLDKIGCEELKTIYKTEAFQNAILDNKTYEALFNKMKESWGLSSLDFFTMDRIDATSLFFLYAQSDFRKRFEEEPLFAKEIGLKASSIGLNDLAIRAAFQLASQNPKDSLELMIEYLNGKELSTPDCFQSLKILGKILEYTPSFIDKELFRSLMEQRLGVLALFISSASFNPSEVIDEESLECIRYFHSLTVLHTLEHPCWKFFWRYIRKNQFPVEDWIDCNQIGGKLSQINPQGNIIPFLQTFTLNASFLIEFVRGMKGVAPLEIENYKPLLFFAFKLGRNSFLVNLPKIDEKTQDSAKFLYEFLDSFYTTTEVSVEDLIGVDIAMVCLKFSSLFGDAFIRRKTMATIQSLLIDTGPVLKEYIKHSVHPKAIFFSCMDRALEEKNLKELQGLSKIYTIWRSDDILGSRVIFGQSEIVSARCEALQRYLADLFRDPFVNEQMTAESAEFHLLRFYTTYLDELIIAQTVYETVDTVRTEFELAGQDFLVNHEAIFKHFSDLLDFFTRKKLLAPLQVTISILAGIERLIDGERIVPISKKHLFMVTELLASALKKPILPEMRASLFFLFGSISVLQLQGEKRGKGLFNSPQLIPFLKLARKVLPEINNSRDKYLVYSDQIPILEGILTKEESELYLSDWESSIIARKETVTFEELNLFSLFICRLDPRLYHQTDMKIIFPRFKNKLFVNQKHFNAYPNIRNCIEIIDIALSRYSHKLLDLSIVPGEFTVFSLLPFYHDFLLQGIIDQRNIADKENLQVSLILTVAKCLRLPKITNLSNPAMKCLLNSLIGKKSLGVFELAKFSKAKLPLATQLEIFYLLIQQLPRFPHADFRTGNAYFMVLKYTYEKGIAYKNKAFSKEQIAEIERILSAPPEITPVIEELVEEVSIN